MAHHGEMEQIRETQNERIISTVYKKLGPDANGNITPESIVNGGKAIGMEIKLSKASKLIAEVDEEGKGYFNFNKFRQCMEKVLAKIRKDTEMYKKSFKKFDLDGNGSIDRTELRNVLCGNGRTMTEQEVEDMFDEADVDGDGELSYEEFVEYFCKI